MGDLAVMQVQEVRRAVVRFERSKVLRAEMRVRLLARQDRKQKREVGVVRIQQIQLAEIERVVAGHRGEVGVELVVGLDEEIAVGVGEDAGELSHELVKLGLCLPIQNNREREIAQRLAVAQSTQTVAQILDVGLLRLVYQYIARVRLRRIVTHLRHKAGLRHIEVAAALGDFLPRLVRCKRRPLGHDIEVARDLQQGVQHQRPRLGDGLFHGQHADNMVADAQMIALGLDIRVHHLIVEKLRGLRLARDAPFVEVQQPAKEPKLPLLVENFDLHEVRKLPGERLDALLQAAQGRPRSASAAGSSCCCW